jgi:hypothetical protein
MKCEQCTSLQEPVEDSLQTLSLDIPQWLQSNGNPTHVKSLENEQQKDGFPNWLSGKEMLETSTHPNTPIEWIASMRDSLAKILVSLESKQVLGKEPAAGFTEKSCVLLAQLDPDTSSWKMSPLLKATVLSKLSKTWPSWGMTVDGCAYEHPMSGHRITATGGSYLPTPVSSDGTTGAIIGKNDTYYTTSTGMPRKVNQNGKNGSVGLGRLVQMWPTPNASDCRDRGNMNNPSIQRRAEIGKQLNLSMVVHPTSGKLNPTWVEWLMGWPLEWTNLKQSVTGKSPSKSQQRLPSWLRSK